MRLRDVARPRDDGSGYDHAAIVRTLTLAQRMSLAILVSGRGEQPDAGESLRELVEAGLAIAASPPLLSMLGEAVADALQQSQEDNP